MKSRFLNVLPAKETIKLPITREYLDFVRKRISYILGDLVRSNKHLERALEDCYIQGMHDAMEALKEKPLDPESQES